MILIVDKINDIFQVTGGVWIIRYKLINGWVRQISGSIFLVKCYQFSYIVLYTPQYQWYFYAT